MRAILPSLCTIACLLTVLTGCQHAPEERHPISSDARLKLAQRIQRPDQAGLTLTQRPDGTIKPLNSHFFSQGEHSTLPMLIRPSARRLPLVRCRVNGRVSFALVDTGSTRSLMDYRGALRTDLTPLSTADEDDTPTFHVERIRGLGGAMNSLLSVATTLTLGTFQLNTVPFYILDDEWGLTSQGWLAGFRVETLLGFDIIKQFEYVTFDYQRDKITLSRRVLSPPPENAQAAPLYVRFGLPVVPSNFAGKPVLAVLDTGGDFGIWIPRSTAKNIPIAQQPQREGLTRRHGVGGTHHTRYIGNYPIDLGGIQIPPSRVHVSMQPTDEPELPFIFIGHRILEKYRVTFNVKEQRVFFAKH